LIFKAHYSFDSLIPSFLGPGGPQKTASESSRTDEGSWRHCSHGWCCSAEGTFWL